MSITPTFHFVCVHCGTAFDLTGERERFTDESAATIGEHIINSECDATFAAGCLDDTCRDCMPAHHKQAAQEQDRQAAEDMK